MPDQALNFDSKDEKSKQADLNVPLAGTLGVGGFTTTPGSTGTAHTKGDDIEIDLKLKAPGGIGAPEEETTTSAAQPETQASETAAPEAAETETKPARAAEGAEQEPKPESAGEKKEKKTPTEGKKPEEEKPGGAAPARNASRSDAGGPEAEQNAPEKTGAEAAPEETAKEEGGEQPPTKQPPTGEKPAEKPPATTPAKTTETQKQPEQSKGEKKPEAEKPTENKEASKPGADTTPKKAEPPTEQAAGGTPPPAPAESPKQEPPEPPSAPARNASRSDAGGPQPGTQPPGGNQPQPPPAGVGSAPDLGRDQAQSRRQQAGGGSGTPGTGAGAPDQKKSLGSRVKDNLGKRWQDTKDQLNPAQQARQGIENAKQNINDTVAPALTVLNARKIFRLDKQIKENRQKINGLNRALAPLQKDMDKKIAEAKKYKRRILYLKIVAWVAGTTIVLAAPDTALAFYILELKQKMKVAGKAAADLKKQLADKKKNLELNLKRRKELFTARRNLQSVFKEKAASNEGGTESAQQAA